MKIITGEWLKLSRFEKFVLLMAKSNKKAAS
jgi:hypothetical protein